MVEVKMLLLCSASGALIGIVLQSLMNVSSGGGTTSKIVGSMESLIGGGIIGGGSYLAGDLLQPFLSRF